MIKLFPKSKSGNVIIQKKTWLTEALKISIKVKDKLYVQYKKCKSVHNECIYKTYKNKLNRIIKAAEKNYYQEKLEINKSNMKKIWSIIKEVIGKNKETQIQTEFKLPTGEVTSDKSTICKKK